MRKHRYDNETNRSGGLWNNLDYLRFLNVQFHGGGRNVYYVTLSAEYKRSTNYTRFCKLLTCWRITVQALQRGSILQWVQFDMVICGFHHNSERWRHYLVVAKSTQSQSTYALAILRMKQASNAGKCGSKLNPSQNATPLHYKSEIPVGIAERFSTYATLSISCFLFQKLCSS